MLKDYTRVLNEIKSSSWLITPEALETLCEIVNMRLEGKAYSDEEIRIRLEEAKNGKKEKVNYEIGGGVGILPIQGSIFPKANLFSMLSGGTSLDVFRNDLRDLAANDEVKQIVLDIDSPGGVDSMIPETAELIREVKSQKPVYAISNTDCCSAALYLGSQATELYSTKSGRVGSIGVFTVREDRTAANEQQGRKIHFIHSGKYKGSGHPDKAYSQEEQVYHQERVDGVMDQFVNDVAVGRKMEVDAVREFADGRVFLAPQAKELGLIDGITSMDKLLGTLVKRNMAAPAAPNKNGQLARLVATDPQEFSEPGTGVATDYTINQDDSYPNRIQTPPPGEDDSIPSTSKTVTGAPQDLKEGRMSDILAELREKLGLSAEVDDATVVAKVVQLKSDAAAIADLNAATEARKAFKDSFPDEYDRMQRLENRDRERSAREYSDKLEKRRFTRKEGTGEEAVDKETPFGLSALALNSIEDYLRELQSDGGDVEKFKTVLDSVFDSGIVDYGVRGSSIPTDEDDDDDEDDKFSSREEAMKLFSEKIATIQEADNLDYKAALAVAARKHPKLFEAWRKPPVGGVN